VRARKTKVIPFAWLAILILVQVIPVFAAGQQVWPTNSESISEISALSTLPVVRTVQVVLTNSQSKATGPYQQEIMVPGNQQYTSLINSNWSNVLFEYQNGTEIPAWIESGGANTSASTTLWLKLDSVPSLGTKTINMMILSQNASVLSPNGPTGEAPSISPQWGQYDDGSLVFDVYANFQGTSLPTSWSLQGFAQFLGSQSTNGGVEIVANGRNSEGAVIYDNPFSENNVAIELSGMYDGAASDMGVGFFSSGPSALADNYNPSSLNGYYASYQFEAPAAALMYNGQGLAAGSSTLPSSGVNYLFTRTTITPTQIDMADKSQTSAPFQIAPSASLATVVSYSGPVSNANNVLYIGGATGGATSFQYVYWVRVRALPASGAMPSYTLVSSTITSSGISSQTSSTTSSSFTSSGTSTAPPPASSQSTGTGSSTTNQSPSPFSWQSIVEVLALTIAAITAFIGYKQYASGKGKGNPQFTATVEEQRDSGRTVVSVENIRDEPALNTRIEIQYEDVHGVELSQKHRYPKMQRGNPEEIVLKVDRVKAGTLKGFAYFHEAGKGSASKREMRSEIDFVYKQ